jgi:hypothetical protein
VTSDNRQATNPAAVAGTPSLVANSCADAAAVVDIVPAGRWRQWMNDTEFRWANRCLPLLVANESGWWLLNPEGFTATWTGDNGPAAISIEYDDERSDRKDVVFSHFGYGIITFGVPFVFKTDPGWELLARGPANLPKDGVTALEGLVETDWSHATFTMNWKITRAGLPVRFEAGEPYCMIVPQRRNDLESFSPIVAPIDNDPQLMAAHTAWQQQRDRMLALKFVSQFGKVEGLKRDDWERDYFKGQNPAGEPAAEHRTKRGLAPFAALPRLDSGD